MKETRNYYTTPSNYVDHSSFGGIISNYDFDGHPTIKDIASRILSDWSFDERCRKNIENRNRKHKKGSTYGEEK